MTKHKLLVYGTLKRNFHNHSILEEKKEESKFLYNSRTLLDTYYMKENGSFPAVFHKDALGQFISGEIYAVSERILTRCDRLEGHPVWYQRRRVPIIGGVDVWMYIMRDMYIADFPIEVKKEQNVQRF